MEHQKILNLLNEANDSKFVTRKWNIFNDHSNTNNGVENEIVYNTEVLKSNICDNNETYILVREGITIIRHQAPQVPFKKCARAPCTKCIQKLMEEE